MWLAAILIYWLRYRDVKLSWIKYGIFTTILFLIITASYGTIANYNIWKNDAVGRYLLPPHDATYFYGYAFFHYWRAIAVNFLIGAIWSGFLWALCRYSSGRLLGKTDIWLGFFTAFAVGWPKIFAYLALVFVLLLAKIIVSSSIFKDKNSAPIASSLVLSALLVSGLSDFFMKIPFLDNLKL